eukprot:117949_1
MLQTKHIHYSILRYRIQNRSILQSLSVSGFTKYSVNHRFLDEGLISHRHAWFWGVFLTDGGLQPPSPNVIGSSHPLSFNATSDKYFHCRLSVNSMLLSRAMVKLLDCEPRRKTFDLKFPESIDPKYLSSLVRGIVDGDGCWAVHSASRPSIWFMIASANYSFLYRIKITINKYCLNTNQDRGTIRQIAKNCHQLSYYHMEECHKIGEWMYQPEHINDGMFLHKKHSRYLLFESVFQHRKLMTSGEKLKMLQNFKVDEVEQERKILRSIISMSKNDIVSPNHFTFAPSFHKA